MEQVISVREVQRNYRRLIDRVKKTKTPLFLGAHQKPEAVLLDIEAFKTLESQALNQAAAWPEVKQRLAWIRQGSRTDISLSDFIHKDRQGH